MAKYVVILSLVLHFLLLHIADLKAQSYNLDVDGYANLKGDLHIYNADDVFSIHIGAGAGFNTQFDTFRYNTILGTLAGSLNYAGSNNTFIGTLSGNKNINGVHNTFVGCLSGPNINYGNYNTFIGSLAGEKALTGERNTYVGAASGIRFGGDDNCFLGNQTGLTGTGNRNVVIGSLSGTTLNSGSENTLLGYNADVMSADLVNATAIGSNTTVNAHHKVRIGNNLIQTIEGQVNFSAGSDRRFKEDIAPLQAGLDFIMDLNPVSYHRKSNSASGLEWGFIAQELKSALNNHGQVDAALVYLSADGYYYVRYDDLFAPIIKAIQELKNENEMLKALIEDMNSN